MCVARRLDCTIISPVPPHGHTAAAVQARKRFAALLGLRRQGHARRDRLLAAAHHQPRASQRHMRARKPIAGAAWFTVFSHGGRAEDHGEHGVGGVQWPQGISDSVFTVILRSSSVRKKLLPKALSAGVCLVQGTTTQSGIFASNPPPDCDTSPHLRNAVLRRRPKISEPVLNSVIPAKAGTQVA